MHNDANLSITITHHVIMSWECPLPRTLYIQLDNTTRENKNQTFLAYLCMLVDKGIFDKIKVGFLLVGHTHDQIDQMFSTFSRRLGRNDAFTLEEMMSIVKESYTPRPEVCHLKETYDFRRFTQGGPSEECCIKKLNDFSFQHQFLIKKKSYQRTYLYGKQYVTSLDWVPMHGLQFLSFILIHGIHASVQEPLVIESELKQAQGQGRNVDYEKCISEKRGLIEKAKTYSRSANSGMWWDTFFEDQALILERYKSNTTTLCNDFVWPTPCPCSDQLI